MSNVKEIEIKTDCRATLEAALKRADEFQGVIILAITKEHAPVLAQSTLSQYQLTFLSAFFQARVFGIFKGVMEKMK